MCDKQEVLVGYLYDELGTAERREFETHLALCAECRGDLAELRVTRVHLSEWAPPEPDLGFRVIRGGTAPAPALPRRRLAPAFAFAAAAVIVLAAAAAIANVELRYGAEGLVVRTGWASQPAATPVAPAETPATVDEGVALAALEQRLQELEAAIAGRDAGAVRASDGTGMSDAEILSRVRTIVGQSESRQRVAIAQLLLQAVNDFERQRRIDLAALQQGIGNSQALTNAEMAQTRDIVNQLMRVATKQEK